MINPILNNRKNGYLRHKVRFNKLLDKTATEEKMQIFIYNQKTSAGNP